MKILLIEDDKNLCEMLRFQLESEHHEVEVCMDGRDGLDLFLQDAYDLVLLDRMLPTMNGLLVLQKARKAGISTPVIMITALGELYDRVEGLDCGADDYLVKRLLTKNSPHASAPSADAIMSMMTTTVFPMPTSPTTAACANCVDQAAVSSYPDVRDGCSRSSCKIRRPC